MNDQKIATIKWFAENIKTTPNAHLWLATAGSIITGKPIDATEYYRTVFGNPHLRFTAESENITQNLLPLKNVRIIQINNNNFFNVALVDLEMIVAWGAYNPAESFSATSSE